MKSVTTWSWNIILIAIVVFWILFDMLLVVFTRFDKEITIKYKEGYGGRSRQQLVTDEKGVIYEVDNTIWLLHFTSPEVFGNLEVGKRYRVKGHGIRVPPLSIFPNIVDAIEVKS